MQYHRSLSLFAELLMRLICLIPALFWLGHATAPDGQIVLVGQGSLVGTSKDGGRHFTLGRVQGRANLTDLALAPDGTGWIASDAGLQAYSVAAAPALATGSTPSSNGAAQ